MNSSYKFRFRRRLFWKTFSVIGHKYEKDQDKMVLYFEGGGVREIANWKNCEVFLGQDWVLAIKSKMEKESGMPVKMDV